jgi:hypothetical protein
LPFDVQNGNEITYVITVQNHKINCLDLNSRTVDGGETYKIRKISSNSESPKEIMDKFLNEPDILFFMPCIRGKHHFICENKTKAESDILNYNFVPISPSCNFTYTGNNTKGTIFVDNSCSLQNNDTTLYCPKNNNTAEIAIVISSTLVGLAALATFGYLYCQKKLCFKGNKETNYSQAVTDEGGSDEEGADKSKSPNCFIYLPSLNSSRHLNRS